MIESQPAAEIHLRECTFSLMMGIVVDKNIFFFYVCEFSFFVLLFYSCLSRKIKIRSTKTCTYMIF